MRARGTLILAGLLLFLAAIVADACYNAPPPPPEMPAEPQATPTPALPQQSEEQEPEGAETPPPPWPIGRLAEEDITPEATSTPTPTETATPTETPIGQTPGITQTPTETPTRHPDADSNPGTYRRSLTSARACRPASSAISRWPARLTHRCRRRGALRFGSPTGRGLNCASTSPTKRSELWDGRFQSTPATPT